MNWHRRCAGNEKTWSAWKQRPPPLIVRQDWWSIWNVNGAIRRLCRCANGRTTFARNPSPNLGAGKSTKITYQLREQFQEQTDIWFSTVSNNGWQMRKRKQWQLRPPYDLTGNQTELQKLKSSKFIRTSNSQVHSLCYHSRTKLSRTSENRATSTPSDGKRWWGRNCRKQTW